MPTFEDNTQTVLYEYVEGQRKKRASDASYPDFFEFFVADQVTRSYALTEEQVLSGITGAPNDGGIDFAYILLNGKLVEDFDDAENESQSPHLHLILGQAKTSKKFEEAVLDRLNCVTSDLLNLNVKLFQFEDVYNADIRHTFNLFRQVYVKLLLNLPNLKISYFYAANRPPKPISSGIEHRIFSLKEKAKERFSAAEVDIQLMGAKELWSRANERVRHHYKIKVQRVFTGRQGYIAIVSLNNLKQFLINDHGQLNDQIFESNVRYYLKSTPVNSSIMESLIGETDIEFWWLNNGITVVSKKSRLDDNIITMTDPQIVNGLQTSIQIFNCDLDGNRDDDERSVLVKFINVEAEAVKDKIIRATNYQNPVSPAMLRATDDFQRKIEYYFENRGLFYDRRKGFWKNKGKPISDIFDIVFLTQSVLSIMHFQPDDARARPSDWISKDENYLKLYSESRPLEGFFFCAKLGQLATRYLQRQTNLSRKDINNLRFYFAMCLSWVLLNKFEPTSDDMIDFNFDNIQPNIFDEVFAELHRNYRIKGADDDLVKSPKFKNDLRREYSGKIEDHDDDFF